MLLTFISMGLTSLSSIESAFAVPSPAQLIQSLSLVPYLYSGLIIFLSSLISMTAIKNRNSKNGSRRWQSWPMFLSYPLLAVALFCSFYFYSQNKKHQLIAKTSMEFRCDLNYHEKRRQIIPTQLHLWRTKVNYIEKYEHFRSMVLQDSHSLLIDIRLPFWYDSGRISLKLRNHKKRQSFTNLYPSELISYLEKMLINKIGKKNLVPNLYLIDYRPTFLMYYKEEEINRLLKIFSNFPQIYQFTLSNTIDEKETKSLTKDLFVSSARPANPFSQHLDWPVARDGFLLDEANVNFPNATHFLNAEELADSMNQEDIYYVAAYASFYKPEITYQQMLLSYFPEKLRRNIIFLDYSSPFIRSSIREIFKILRGKKFVTIGIDKFDIMHYGQDFAYQSWKNSQFTQSPYRYLGLTSFVPEAASIQAYEENRKGLFGRNFIKLWGNFYERTLNEISLLVPAISKLSVNLKIFIFGLIMGVLFSALNFGEYLSRFKRNEIKFLLKKVKSDFENSYLILYQSSLENLFKTCVPVEMASLLLKLLIIAPFFTIFQESNSGSSLFTWFFLFLTSLNVLTPTINNPLGDKVSLMKFIISSLIPNMTFSVLIVYLSDSFVAFLCGLESLNCLMQIFCLIKAKKLINRIFIKENTQNFSERTTTKNPISRLNQIDTRIDIGIKAMRLGFFSTHPHPFFSISPGFVLSSAYSSPMDDSQLLSCLSAKKKYVVRSNAFFEDSLAKSYAGKFKSDINVSYDNILNSIQNIQNSYQDSFHPQNTVLIQEMVQPDFSGVLFTCSPKNSSMSQICFCKGHLKNIVNGITNAKEVMIGRYSGELIVSENSDDFNEEIKKVIVHAYLVGRILENYFKIPQDIEWGYSLKTNQLTLFQTRNITATLQNPAFVNEKSQILLKMTHSLQDREKIKAVYWEKNELSEIIGCSQSLTLSIYQNIYSTNPQKGSLGKALSLLQFHKNRFKSASEITLNVFQHLYFRSYPFTFHSRSLRPPKRPPDPEQVIKLIHHQLKMIKTKGEPHEELNSVATILHKLEVFIEEVYPISFLASLPLENIQKDKDIRTHKLKNLVNDLNFRIEDYSLALKSLSQNPAENINDFILQWGHRKINDYDFSSPCFSQRPLQAIEYAENFKNFKGKGFSQLHPIDSISTLDFYSLLKEYCKNECLKYWHSILPLIKNIENYFLLNENDFFYLTMDDLKVLSNLSLENQKIYLIEVIGKNKDLHENFKNINIPEKISITTIERMESIEDKIPEITDHKSAMGQGQFLSGKKNIIGKTVYWPLCKNESLNECIVILKYLTPDITKFFDEAKGIIVENGSLLSHAAIVAREVDFPIIYFQQAMNLIPEQCYIKIDHQGAIQFV